jgi:hypothetical protein
MISFSKKPKLEDVLADIRGIEASGSSDYSDQIKLYDLKKKVVFGECKGRVSGDGKTLADRVRKELAIESGFKKRADFENFIAATVFEALPRLATEKKMDADALAQLLVHSKEHGNSFLPVHSEQLHYQTFNTHEGGAFYKIAVALPNGQTLEGHVKKVPNRRFETKKKVREAVASFSDDVMPHIHAFDGHFVDFYRDEDILYERVMRYKRDGDTASVKKELVEALNLIKRLGEEGLANQDKFRESGKLIVPVVGSYVADMIDNIIRPCKGMSGLFAGTFSGHSEKGFKHFVETDPTTSAFVQAFTQDYNGSMPKSSYFGNGDPHARNFIYDNGKLKIIDWDFARFGIPRYSKLFSMLGLDAQLEREIVVEALGEEAWKPYLKEKMLESLKSAVINYEYMFDPNLTPDAATTVMRKEKIKYYYTVAKRIASEGMAVAGVMDDFFHKWYGTTFSEVTDPEEFRGLSAKYGYDGFTLEDKLQFTALDPKTLGELKSEWGIRETELEASRKKTRKHRWIGAGVAGLVLLAGLGIYALGGGDVAVVDYKNPEIEYITGAPKVVMTANGLQVESGGGEYHTDYILSALERDERGRGGELSAMDYVRLQYAFGKLKPNLRLMADEAGITFDQARDLLMSHYLKNPYRHFKLNLLEPQMDVLSYRDIDKYGIVPVTGVEFSEFFDLEHGASASEIGGSPERTMRVAFAKLKSCIDQVKEKYGMPRHTKDNGDSVAGQIYDSDIYWSALVVYATDMNTLDDIIQKSLDARSGDEDWPVGYSEYRTFLPDVVHAFVSHAGTNFTDLGDDSVDNFQRQYRNSMIWAFQSILGPLFGFQDSADACFANGLYESLWEVHKDVQQNFGYFSLLPMERYHYLFHKGDDMEDQSVAEHLLELAIEDGGAEVPYDMYAAMIHSNIFITPGNALNKQNGFMNEGMWLTGHGVGHDVSEICTYEEEGVSSAQLGSYKDRQAEAKESFVCGAQLLGHLWKQYEGQEGREAKTFAAYFSNQGIVDGAVQNSSDAGYWDRYYDWRIFLPKEVRDSTDRALMYFPMIQVLNGENIESHFSFPKLEALIEKGEEYVLEPPEED